MLWIGPRKPPPMPRWVQILQDNLNHLHTWSRTWNAWAKTTDSPSHRVYLLTLLPLFCRIFLRVCIFQHCFFFFFFFGQEHCWRPCLSCKGSEEGIFSGSWVDCASNGRRSLFFTEEGGSDATANTSLSGETEDEVTRPWGTSLWVQNGLQEREMLPTAHLTRPSKQVNTAHS